MSEVSIRQIQFNQDYGTYLAGDLVDVTYDSDVDTSPTNGSTVGYKTYLNGVETPCGGIPDVMYGITQEGYNYISFCYSTSLVEPTPYGFDFPLAITRVTENSPSCTTPIVCDLIVAIPEIFPASSPTAIDAEIRINATSTYPIQYKIGGDFNYDDGTSQTVNLFTGLLPGTYRIYLRDERNCAANLLVDVGYDSTYTVKYRFEYDDLVGGVTRIDVAGRTFEGSVTPVIGAGIAAVLSLRGEGEQDKFKSLISTQISVTFISDGEGQFVDLYTDDPEEYRVFYYKNDVLKWNGKLLPNQYQEDYKPSPYPVNFIANDGTPSLNEISFIRDDNLQFYGNKKAIELIAFCLSKTKIELNIRVGINLYATDMSQTDADDPLDQAYIDLNRYYLIKDEVPTVGDVLKYVIESFGARLVMWDGVWNIVRISELVDSYDFREFDSAGAYISNGTQNNVFDITNPITNEDIIWCNGDQNLEIVPAYGTLRVVYDLGLKKNLFKNGDFSLSSTYNSITGKYDYAINTEGITITRPYPLSIGYTGLSEGRTFSNVALFMRAVFPDQIDGSATIQSYIPTFRMGLNDKLTLRIRFAVPPVFSDNKQVPYIKLRYSLTYSVGSAAYLKSDSTWTSSPNIITYYATEFNKYIEHEITFSAPLPEASEVGEQIDFKLYHPYAFQSDYADLDAMRAISTAGAGTVGLRVEVPFVFNSLNMYGYYEVQQNTEPENEPYIVRGLDYDSLTNPRQFILITMLEKVDDLGSFQLDKIQLFLSTYDSIVRELPGQVRNKSLLEKTIYHGFSTQVFSTLPNKDFIHNYNSFITVNVVSFEQTMSAYFRDSLGVGYEFWARDGIAESGSLHGIILKEMAAQYNKPSRFLRGSIKCRVYPGLIAVFKNLFDGMTYIPMSIEIDDKRNIYRTEMIELVDNFSDPGSDGSGESPYSSAFSTGFADGGFD